MVAGLTKAFLGVGDNQKELSFSDHTHNLPDLDGILPVTNGGTGCTSLDDLKTNMGVSAALQVVVLGRGDSITKNHYYGGVVSHIDTSKSVYTNHIGNATVCGSTTGSWSISNQADDGGPAVKDVTTLSVTGSGPYTIQLTSDYVNALAIVFVSD